MTSRLTPVSFMAGQSRMLELIKGRPAPGMKPAGPREWFIVVVQPNVGRYRGGCPGEETFEKSRS